jgi:class 3 adenylate cyclase
MKNIILTLILSVLTINGYSQNAYDITNDSPIAIRASSVQHLTYFDATGKLNLNEVLEQANAFKVNKVKHVFSTEGKNWFLFSFKNSSNKSISLDIGYDFEDRDPKIYALDGKNIIKIKDDIKDIKNHFTFVNILENGSKKNPSKNIRINFEKGTEISILIQSNDLNFDKLFFRDGETYDEWARGPLYLQGIYIGMFFSLILFAAFSSYKYRDKSTLWYLIFLVVITLNYISGIEFDGKRFSEFLTEMYPDFVYIWSAYLPAFCFYVYLLYAFDIKIKFPKIFKLIVILLFLFISNGIIYKILFETEFRIMSSYELETRQAVNNYLGYLYKYSRFTLTFANIYVALRLLKNKDLSSKYTVIALALYLPLSFTSNIVHYFFDDGSLIFYNDFFRIGSTLITLLAVIIMGFGTISRSKDIQDQLISKTEENNRILNTQNEILEVKVIERTSELVAQTKKTESLMLNILPASIADRLKSGEEGISDSYQNATILFSDLVGFTKMSSGKSPENLVFLLNDLFKRFDIRAQSLGLEKIKTIGDAYMVVGGLPTKDEDHAVRVTKMALGMYEDLSEFNKEHDMNLDMRIGINSGPVVAGVIGHSKFSYDLWGNTVNVASRMESTSIPGEIQVSPSTYEQIKNHFNARERELIECKGIGLIMTYFVGKPAPTAV